MSIESRKEFFPKVTVESGDADSVVLDMGHEVTVRCARGNEGEIFVGTPSAADPAGLIGGQWKARAERAAKEYFNGLNTRAAE